MGADAGCGKEMTKPHEKSPKPVYLGQIIQGRQEAIKRQEKWTKKGYVAGEGGAGDFQRGNMRGGGTKRGGLGNRNIRQCLRDGNMGKVE